MGKVVIQKNRLQYQYYAPRYFVTEASRLVHISSARVHRWLEGYEYEYASELRRQKPIFLEGMQSPGYPNYASFIDLVTLLFIKQFLDLGMSLQKLRKALNEAKQRLGTDHFAHQRFFTDGRNICLELKDEGNLAILELLSGGQWVISDLILQLAKQVDFDETTKLAQRWFPEKGDGLVVLDPLISFGRPIIIKKAITTENIYDLYIAEGEKIGPVCDWMDLAVKEAEAAIKFEEYLVE